MSLLLVRREIDGMGVAGSNAVQKSHEQNKRKGRGKRDEKSAEKSSGACENRQ